MNGEKLDVPYKNEFYIEGSQIQKQIKNRLKKIAKSPFNVFIQGENGTGKELVARYISQNNGNKLRPFQTVNVASLTSSLFEDELFGHVKNAYTGAGTNRVGLLRNADKGILFLDEIGDLPIAAQASLLRFIQNGEVKPVGSDKTFNVDVRVVSATNVDVDKSLREGTIREDLYHRLNEVSFKTTPLRENRNDIPHLLSYFVNKYAVHFPKKPMINACIVQLLKQFEWKGNIRQLENKVKQFAIFNDELELFPSDYKDFFNLLNHNIIMNKKKQWGEDRMLKIVGFNYINAVRQYVNQTGNKKNLTSILEISKSEIDKMNRLNIDEHYASPFYKYPGLRKLFENYAYDNLSMSYVLTRFASAHIGTTVEGNNDYRDLINTNKEKIKSNSIKNIYPILNTKLNLNKLEKIMSGEEELRLSEIISGDKYNNNYKTNNSYKKY